jgi:hypothetical protein
LLGSHPKLDWIAVVVRARAQGYLRMVLLAISLARKYFHATVPDAIAAAELSDPIIESMVQRITVHWQADKAIGAPNNKTLWLDRLRLHDGVVRRARYVARTLFLPGPHHVANIPVPRRLRFAYVPIKIAHDVVMLPVLRAYLSLIAQRARLQDSRGSDVLALAMMPGSGEVPPGLERHEQARADARQVLAADSNNAAAWRNLGKRAVRPQTIQGSVAVYDRAIALAPDNAAG